MFIKKLKPNTYDIFVGNGWNQWARIVRRGADLEQVGGNFDLDRRSFNHLRGRLSK